MKPSILFLGKDNDFYCKRALEFIKLHCDDFEIFLGKSGDSFPEKLLNWKGDYIISYLSPWIIPKTILEIANRDCINFHPGSPEYPGIGCTNFAIYNEEDSFAVTCHHMKPKVDTGQIISVKRIQIYKTDTVFSLTQKCYGFILVLFYEIMDLILNDKRLPESKEIWTRKPYTRKELNALCRITPEMSNKEMLRRIKAVTFPNAPGAFIDKDGIKFKY